MFRPKKFFKSSPSFIISILSSTEEAEKKQAKLRAKRLKTTTASVIVHILLVPVFLSLFIKKTEVQPDEVMVFISNAPLYLPSIPGQKESGGGGGGGKKEKPPPQSGRLPETVRPKLIAPDPKEPRPLVPPEDKDELIQKLITPVEIPQNLELPLGDIQAPPSELKSAGSGTGGGIGTGKGEGYGSGSGTGGGSGSGGGVGSGSGTGIGDGNGPFPAGNGVTAPVPIFQPLPEYNEEARRLRIEGNVMLEAVVRRDGRVDTVKIIRGLGHGLDESAVQTITDRWRFRPGTFKGKPVSVRVNIEVIFRLL